MDFQSVLPTERSNFETRKQPGVLLVILRRMVRVQEAAKWVHNDTLSGFTRVFVKQGKMVVRCRQQLRFG